MKKLPIIFVALTTIQLPVSASTDERIFQQDVSVINESDKDIAVMDIHYTKNYRGGILTGLLRPKTIKSHESGLLTFAGKDKNFDFKFMVLPSKETEKIKIVQKEITIHPDDKKLFIYEDPDAGWIVTSKKIEPIM